MTASTSPSFLLLTLLILVIAHAGDAFQLSQPLPDNQDRNNPSKLKGQREDWSRPITLLSFHLLSICGILVRPLPSYAGPTVVKDDAYRKTVTELQEKAFTSTNRFNFQEADKAWSDIIKLDERNAAAWSNRGNTRTSMGLCREAIVDFDQAIKLAPKEPDPNLGRGVANECLKRYEEALVDYEVANQKNQALTGVEDPVTFNNRANAEAGLGRYSDALNDYRKAAKMQKDYVFPLASAALMLYQLGDEAEAIKQMRLLLVKYPDFTDMKAALAVIYWKQGELGKAETYYYNVINEDPRYRKVEWVREVRKWPPRLVELLENFQNLKLSSSAAAASSASVCKVFKS